METDAHAELRADVPLFLDEGAQRGVVGIRGVLLETEGGRHEVDRHAQHLAEREHDGGGLGRGEAGQLVDGQLAQVAAADRRGERRSASGSVFLVATLHLEHRRPDRGEELVEGGVVELESGGGDARAGLGHDDGRDVGHLGRLVERHLRREVEGDVAGEQAAADERVLAIVEFAADGLVVGVERPGDLPVMETGLELGEYAAVAHALDALALVALGDVGADEGERHGVEPVGEHGVDVVDELARNGILVGGEADLEGAHRPLDGRPVQRGEARADAQRALAEPGRGRGENRRGRVMLLDEVLQLEQVGPGGGEEGRAGMGHAVSQRSGAGVQFPGAVTRSVFPQRPFPSGGREPALLILGSLAGHEVGGQGRPVETEVRRNARVRGDTQVVLEKELVDRGHGRS